MMETLFVGAEVCSQNGSISTKVFFGTEGDTTTASEVDC